jgi:hypothetical protein
VVAVLRQNVHNFNYAFLADALRWPFNKNNCKKGPFLLQKKGLLTKDLPK